MSESKLSSTKQLQVLFFNLIVNDLFSQNSLTVWNTYRYHGGNHVNGKTILELWSYKKESNSKKS